MIEAWSITIKPEWLYDRFDHDSNRNNHIIILTKRMASFEIFKIDFFFFFTEYVTFFVNYENPACILTIRRLRHWC